MVILFEDKNMSIKQKSFFCSWSGGKDSCLAFYRAIKEGGKPHSLLTMMEDGYRSKAHYLSYDLLAKQASSIGVPLISRSASWEDYERVFSSALQELKKQGVEAGVFGDIDLEGHREWVKKVCEKANLKACEPLWKSARKDLLREFIEAGFQAVVVAVKDGALEKDVLGKTLDWELIKHFERTNLS